MAIIQLINGEQLPECIGCAICGKQITPDNAVAGLLNADNQQQFACNGHFWSPHQLITGWADFMAGQRTKHTGNLFTAEYGGTIDARLMH